jgi:hypothetical protein
MNAHISFMLIAAFGALIQEAIHWFDLRKKLEEEEQKKILNSKHYWIITVIMIIVSGVGTWILFFPFGTKLPTDTILTDIIPIRIQLVLGAAFPLIFKKLVAKQQDLGINKLGTKKPTFTDVFNTYMS